MFLALEIEYNSLVVDLESLELRVVGGKFREIYGLMRIILEYVGERAVGFYERYWGEKERGLEERKEGGGYCRGCKRSVVMERIRKENVGLTEVSLGGKVTI